MAIPHTCPICQGTGKASKPPWIAGDANDWSDTSCGPWTCNGCLGSGIVWEYEQEVYRIENDQLINIFTGWVYYPTVGCWKNFEHRGFTSSGGSCYDGC